MNEARSAVAPVETLIMATPRRLELRVHVRLTQHQQTPTSNPENDSPRTIPVGDFYHRLGLPQRSAGYPRYACPQHRPNSVRVVYEGPSLEENRANDVAPTVTAIAERDNVRRMASLGMTRETSITATIHHAQSLKGISTIAWGCHSAAPATPGQRLPTSAQLCRSCLPGAGRGSLTRRGRNGHQDAMFGQGGHGMHDSG